MASSGPSVAEVWRRFRRAWAGFLGAGLPATPAKARARSSLFHLRMETRHRDTYDRLQSQRDPQKPG